MTGGKSLDKIQLLVYALSIEQEEIRCHSCGSIIAKRLKLTQGHIQIRCRKCKTDNDISFL